MMKELIISRYGLLDSSEEEQDEERGKEASGNDVTTQNKFRVAFCNLSLTLKDGYAIQIPNFDYLHIGSIGSAYNKEKLLEKRITHILCLSGIIKLIFPDEFIYKRIVMIDKPGFDMFNVLYECFAFIESTRKIYKESNGQEGRLLVHCMQGKSRCVSICCAYLITYHDYKYNDALAMVQQVRPMACPNSGFAAKLRAMEATITTATTKEAVKESEI